MSVEIDPSELGFRRPFTVEVAQILKIKNPNKNPVAFKVKTTAPKQYCVRPNSGRIEPDHEVEVTVLLQAMKQEPPLDTRCRDKFLVQSVNVSGHMEFTNIQQIWDSVEKSAVQEKKIRVNWLAPPDGSAGVAATPVRQSLANGVESTPDTHPPASSPPSDDSHIAQPSAVTTADTREVEPEPEAEAELAPSVVSGTTLATAKSAVGATYEELLDRLAKAQETIAHLTQESQSGVRQRKTTSNSDEKAQPAATEQLATAVRQGTEGVPIQVVAILCLVSFLLAYFFF